MCDFSKQLIAWLDGELPADEGAEVGRHLRGCAECRGELSVYEKLSNAVEAYCEATMRVTAPRKATVLRSSVAAGVGVAAIAAVMAITIALPRAPHSQLPGQPVPEESVLLPTAKVTPERVVTAKKHRHMRAPEPAQTEEARSPVAQPAMQITIPAEAVLPPGAAPQGMSYVAEVWVPVNGSAQPLLVWP